ncbi:MAG TPA: lysophospholipid acyltransferase family protein [Allosphingosinicella sp.]|nr:lysophospholipid acyltransferase family protein [Allosphingosinicella sp.]
MALFRSILFALIFYPWTVIAVLISLPASLFGTRAVRACAHVWAHGHRWCARYLLGISSRYEGDVPEGAHLFAVKHQSMFETLEMFLLLREPAVVLKHELTRIPLWGWVVRRYGVIPIDRAGGAAALRRMMRAAESAIAEGRPILIFPEGTRVAPGEQPPLQPGFAGLYRALKLPVVPVAVNSGRLWPRNAFVKRPGTVTVRILPEIAPGLPRREIQAAVHKAINQLEPGQ